MERSELGDPIFAALHTASLSTVSGTSVLRNADHAFDTANHATDGTADDGSHSGADWAGGAMAHGGALLTSADNALCLCSDGR
jgi:hypothetical protein